MAGGAILRIGAAVGAILGIGAPGEFFCVGHNHKKCISLLGDATYCYSFFVQLLPLPGDAPYYYSLLV